MEHKNHPEYYLHLNRLKAGLRKEIPETMAAFGQLHASSMAEGALSLKVKELISLGIAIAERCDGCISAHVRASLKAGANRKEIAETIGVAMMMGGGPATMHGAEAYEALLQYEEKESTKTK